VNHTRLTRLAALEAAGAPPWQEVGIQVLYIDALDRSTEVGPVYRYRIPVHQLRPGWCPRGEGDERP
jgi:hypothetical protein